MSLDETIQQLSKGSCWVTPEELTEVLMAAADVCHRNVPGVFLEMGTAQGKTAIAISRLLQHLGSNKQLHCCDAFQGLPKPGVEDGDTKIPMGEFASSVHQTLQRFREADIPMPIMHVGWFHEIQDYPEIVAFAFCDSDRYESIQQSLDIVWPRLSPGGVILVHDYQAYHYPGVARAVNHFLVQHPDACLTPIVDEKQLRLARLDRKS